jgi:hypothetical protein
MVHPRVREMSARPSVVLATECPYLGATPLSTCRGTGVQIGGYTRANVRHGPMTECDGMHESRWTPSAESARFSLDASAWLGALRWASAVL